MSNIFNIQRFGKYIQFNYYHRRKYLLQFLGGITGIALILMIIQFVLFFGSLDNWNNLKHAYLFQYFMLITTALFVGTSFPLNRNRSKLKLLLLVPASNFEKFVFELFLNILVVFILLPLIAWLVANSVGYVSHFINPELKFYHFSICECLRKMEIIGTKNNYGIRNFLFLLYAFTIPFLGTFCFSKNSILKILLYVSAFCILYLLWINFWVTILKVHDYERIYTKNVNIAITNQNSIKILISAFIHFMLLLISYFKLKEREA